MTRPSANGIDPLLTSDEVATELGIDRSTLTRWVADGRITPAHKNPGRTGAYLFTLAAVARARETRDQTS